MHSRFGFSLVCLPDINRDGIDGRLAVNPHTYDNDGTSLDLAISAPSEKDDIHTGSVYIYLGSRTSPLRKYAQKIVPSQFLVHLKPAIVMHDFGFTLSSQSPFGVPFLPSSVPSSNATGLVDYPSLIIGVPKANMIVHLR